MSPSPTSTATSALGSYLSSSGGSFHPALYSKQDEFGTSIYTSQRLSPGENVVCCPFALAVTPTLARTSIPTSLFPAGDDVASPRRKARQPHHEVMALYLCLHLLPASLAARLAADEGLALQHRVYVENLPASEAMRTTLYFSPAERELLRGSNLYGATEERERGWRDEWEDVRNWVADEDVRREVGWERWLWACTLISSRAFPSSLIDGDKPNSTPVLFPGIDMLNHRPTSKITWSADVHVETAGTGAEGKKGKGSLTIVLDEAVGADEQIFNTYGAKSNEELLLGYGFVLAANPADFVALKLSLPPACSPALFDLIHDLGLENLRHFVPRSGALPGELLAQMRLLVASAEEVEELVQARQESERGAWEQVVGFVSWENELDVLDALEGMLQSKLQGLESADASSHAAQGVRPDVAEMVRIYRRGQIEIIKAAIAYRERLFEETIQKAEEDGVQLAFEDDEMEEIDEEEE
ncbi:hypothetical protein JCM1841_005116 [Sporobolomyces salmonicolor]